MLPFISQHFGFSFSVQKCKIYKTIILHVVLCGYKTLSLTLREQNRLKVFLNNVLKGLSGHKRDETGGGWGKPNEESQNLYSLQNIIRVIKPRMTMYHAWNGEGCIQHFGSKPWRIENSRETLIYKLTSWSSVLLESYQLCRYSMISQQLFKSKGSVQCSQTPSTSL